MGTIRIATRASAQARTQAESVAARLVDAGHEAELVFIETFGDRTQADEVPLHSIGGQGVFVKEVQRAVLDGRADVAVHSAKDLPTGVADGLHIAAFTERRDAADALVGRPLVELPSGATVATGSVRRRAQLRRARPDLEFVELRGNIHTRLEKVPAGGSIVMAVAALEILGLTDRIAERLDPAEFVPAVGQGCVAVECRADDDKVIVALARIDHEPTRREVLVERAFLAELGSGCSLPVGAYVDGAKLYAFLADEMSGITVSETIALSGELDADIELARRTARDAHEHVLGG
ncbi:MAG TPA: hydroxymethylbilane synthase [Ilumatobacter sp.]|jgi:hydroxymethylbilane synthase|nr:hydroxymethylbilane synthase [Ilumatobacter sp.]